MQWTNITTACIVIEIGIYRIKVYVHAASEIHLYSVFISTFTSITSFLYKEVFYKKMSLKNPIILRKCKENLQPQMPELQF